MVDFRSEKSESAEGKGRARRAWDAYCRRIERISSPVLEPAAEKLALRWTEDLLGFWLMWHIYGGFEGLEAKGMHRSTIWRKVKQFRLVFKVHPDEYEVPGITLDLEKLWADALTRRTAEGR